MNFLLPEKMNKKIDFTFRLLCIGAGKNEERTVLN